MKIYARTYIITSSSILSQSSLNCKKNKIIVFHRLYHTLSRLTYRLTQPADTQLVIPDLAPFFEPDSGNNYEIFFVEVKKASWQNTYLGDGLVKLGKEIHASLNKLIKKKSWEFQSSWIINRR